MLQVLKERAMESRIALRARLANALHVCEHELKQQPWEWGEPKFEHKIGKVVVCIGFVDRFRVTYGISTQDRTVYVRQFCDYFD
jgi:hypothetical protein